MKTSLGRRKVAGWHARYLDKIYKHQKSFPEIGITRELLIYTAVSHTRALRCNRTYKTQHALSITPNKETQLDQEELDRCPFCRRQRPYIKGNTPHLHIECTNKYLRRTRDEAAQVLQEAITPALALIRHAPSNINPQTFCESIHTSLLDLDNEPIPTVDTFEQDSPKTHQPAQKRITPHLYWKRSRARKRHTHHNTAIKYPEAASTGLIPGAYGSLDYHKELTTTSLLYAGALPKATTKAITTYLLEF